MANLNRIPTDMIEDRTTKQRLDELLAERAQLDKSKETLLFTASNGLNGNELALYLSQDGINLKPLHSSSIFRSGVVTRDISIIYHNNYYYLTFGARNTDATADVVGIAKTKDFIDFETWNISLNGFQYIWAPQWFIDGNNVYILVSCGDGTTEVDVTGTAIPFLKSYYIKASNTDLTAFGSPVLMVYSKTNNRIDQAVYKVDGIYHLFVKNEYAKTMEHYTYSGSSIEGATWTYLQDIDFGTRVEGPSLVYYQNKYWLYADGYSSRTSWVCTSIDLSTWSAPIKVVNPSNLRTQHFDTIVLTDKQKDDILNFLSKKTLDEKADILKRLNPFKTVLELKNYVVNKVFTPEVNQNQDVVYVVYASDTVTINSINISEFRNPVDFKQWAELKFAVFGNGSIIFENNTTNGVITPNGQNYAIGKNYGSNDTILTIEKVYQSDAFYRIQNALNIEQALKNSIYLTGYNMVDLATLAVGGVVSNLVLADNTVYFTTTTLTISSVDITNLNRIRSLVYFSLFSGSSTTTLTITNGASIVCPGNVDYVISKTNKNNENLIPFTRVYSTLKMIGA